MPAQRGDCVKPRRMYGGLCFAKHLGNDRIGVFFFLWPFILDLVFRAACIHTVDKCFVYVHCTRSQEIISSNRKL